MQFGKYRFAERLAIGGMAEVFLAIAQGGEGFEKPVVIKRLLPQLAENPRFLQMFFDEARIMLSLQHGNIVQILDMGNMGGLPFLTLEYVDGRDLRTTISRAVEYNMPIPYGLAAYIACEVCRALDYAHRKLDPQGHPLHIVHRDVGPSNIFLSFEGGVKIGDFGLAKARDNFERTETGTIKGKFSYLSPEQAEGQEVDHRSDIFSLGTTLYEMTCGIRPFVGDTDLDIVMRVREVRYPPPTEVVKGYPLELAVVIQRAMQKDPASRYNTASEMREPLLRFLQHQALDTGERQLSEFLKKLFSAERRTNSFLIRLPAIDALPAPVTAVAHDGAFSVFQDDKTSPAPSLWADMIVPSQASPPPRVVTPPPIPSMSMHMPISAQKSDYSPPVAVPSRKRHHGIIWIIAAIVVVVAVLSPILYKVLVPALATLQINTVPVGAKVFVDGNDTYLQTPTILSNLKVGNTYMIALRHPETEEAIHRFQPQELRTYATTYTLKYLEEDLTIQSTPQGSEVVVESELRGNTPLAIRLRRGREYSILLRHPDFQPKTVRHQANQSRDRVNLTLDPLKTEKENEREQGKENDNDKDKPKPATLPRVVVAKKTGILEVHSDVAADILINGRLAGTTPGFEKLLPVGRYRVTVKLKGKDVQHQATVPIEEHKTYRLTLTR